MSSFDFLSLECFQNIVHIVMYRLCPDKFEVLRVAGKFLFCHRQTSLSFFRFDSILLSQKANPLWRGTKPFVFVGSGFGNVLKYKF